MKLNTDQGHVEEIAIESIDQVMTMVSEWHTHVCSQLLHMTHLPVDGTTEITVAVPSKQEDGSWIENELVLKTETERVAFIAGLREALALFEHLPFYKVEHDATEKPTQDSGA